MAVVQSQPDGGSDRRVPLGHNRQGKPDLLAGLSDVYCVDNCYTDQRFLVVPSNGAQLCGCDLMWLFQIERCC